MDAKDRAARRRVATVVANANRDGLDVKAQDYLRELLAAELGAIAPPAFGDHRLTRGEVLFVQMRARNLKRTLHTELRRELGYMPRLTADVVPISVAAAPRPRWQPPTGPPAAA